MHKCFCFIILILACCMSGCKGKKVVVPASDAEVTIAPMALVADSARSDLPEWTDIYMPFKLSAELPEEMGVSGRALMIRDSIIHLSIRVMGIEGAVALINQDSIFFVDKYHKLFLADGLSALLGSYEMSVGDLQNLLLGRPFVPAPSMQEISWGALNEDLATMTAAVFDMPGKAEADCWFFLPQESPFGPMASMFELSLFPAASDTPLLRASVEWSIKDAKFNTGRQVNFSLPRGFGEIRVEDLARIFMEM